MEKKSEHPPQFVFAVCQVGAEATLKKEFQRIAPFLKPAFSRPGIVTFKVATPDWEGRLVKEQFEVFSVFAREYGRVLKKCEGTLAEMAKETAQILATLSAGSPQPILHVFERDRFRVGQEPLSFQAGALAAQARKAIQALSGSPAESPTPVRGQRVLDVLVVEENQWIIGTHVHGPKHSIFPGGHPHWKLPHNIPSRAYLKFKEALALSGVAFGEQEEVIEMGCAPGGMTAALLERKARIVGIDLHDMDPRIYGIAQQNKPGSFRHIRNHVAKVQRHELIETPTWIVLDLNIKPEFALSNLAHFLKWYRSSLQGVVLTLKLNEWSYAEKIGEYLQFVKKFGFHESFAKQLPSNRQEFCIVAWRKK